MSSRGFLSLRVVSCLFASLRVSSRLFAWFHISSRGFMSLRVVSCLFEWFHVSSSGFMSLHGFMSSRQFDIFVLLSDLRVAIVSNGQRRLRVGLISSCCFQIFASPSCPTDSGVFPAIFILCPFILSMMNLTPVI